MGCCNKKPDERPVGWLRWTGGLALLAAVEATGLALLAAGAPFSRRCRKVLPFYRTFARERLASVLRREGFRVGAPPPAPACPAADGFVP